MSFNYSFRSLAGCLTFVAPSDCRIVALSRHKFCSWQEVFIPPKCGVKSTSSDSSVVATSNFFDRQDEHDRREWNSDDEEVDDFPDYKFDVLWQQKCWDILYKLYFDVDSAAFLCDISAEAMGQEFYNDYVSTI